MKLKRSNIINNIRSQFQASHLKELDINSFGKIMLAWNSISRVLFLKIVQRGETVKLSFGIVGVVLKSKFRAKAIFTLV